MARHAAAEGAVNDPAQPLVNRPIVVLAHRAGAGRDNSSENRGC
jgi:hypothetical protein